MICFDLRTLIFSLLITGFVVLAPAGRTLAAPPWETLAPFKRIDADPNNAYPVAETNGPWMIMAASFRGETADKDAKALVHELRRKYKLPAYTYKQHYDFTGAERGKGFNRYGQPKMMKYQSGEAFDEVAVLVGDYDTVDDPRAERTLQKIKFLQPESMHAEEKEAHSKLRNFYRNATSKENQKRGPMGHAFVGTNPLLPKEYFVTPGVDKLVLEMNEGVTHSLLDCPGKYTVKVATFNGAAVVDSKKIKEVEKGKSLGSRLAEAAENAHKLTEALRNGKYDGNRWDAYEFHDREKSIVCVGSFRRIGAEYPDGHQEMDPEVRKLIDHFTADPEVVNQGRAASLGLDKAVGVISADSDAIRRNATPKPRVIDGIPLDVEPQPYEVPHRSISTAYQRSMRSDF